MREIKRNIEQLEEAIQQLDKQTSTGARLALLLLDNQAELLMYDKVQQIFERDSQLKFLVRPKYPAPKRQKINKYFDKKANFLASEAQQISQDESYVLKIGHKLRNEAYHKGVMRDSIILCVAMAYFEVVCKILPRLWVGQYAFSNLDEPSMFLQRFGIQGSVINRETLEEICEYLLRDKSCPVPKLCEALSEDLLNRTRGMLKGLEYLTSNARPRATSEQILKEIQFSHTLEDKDYVLPSTEEELREFLRDRLEKEQEFLKVRDEHLLRYKPPVTISKIEQWSQRARGLKSETQAGSALKKFYDLDADMLEIDEIINEAIAQTERE